ncbi:MAG: hypothetical protein ACYC4L_21895 [Chloroflexota bacterium]
MNFRKRYQPQRSRPLAALAGVLLALGAASFVLPYNLALGNATLGSAMVFGGIALFALGWAVAGAGLRSGGSTRRGVVLGLLAYLAVGLVWAVVYYQFVWNPPVPPSTAELVPSLLYVALTWPWALPLALGWFGPVPR